jgi:hypothetical protein
MHNIVVVVSDGVCGVLATLLTWPRVGTAGTAMVNEVALSSELKDQLGAINGAGQTMSALMRAVGPSIAGGAWSIVAAADTSFGQFVPFWLLALLCATVMRLYHVA